MSEKRKKQNQKGEKWQKIAFFKIREECEGKKLATDRSVVG